MWKLRTHYYAAHVPLKDITRRTSDLSGIRRYSAAITRKTDILRNGLMIEMRGVPRYEYWVAPSQIVSFEVIEYEDET